MKMSRNTTRLLISFGVSLICALSTHYWYVSGTTNNINYENQAPIARLAERKNEVQRKPLRRLIWQDIGVNESLYSGEQVRTQLDASATIEILETGDLVELEPGSLITLESDAGKLQLDFLEGHLFIKSSGASDNLTLKSGDKQIELNGADLSVGKSASGQTDIQVYKGSVQGVAASVDPFEPLMPQPYSEVYVSTNSSEGVLWEWKKDIDPDSIVELEIGPSRSKLSPFANIKREGNRLRAMLPPGEHYWRLTARNPQRPDEKIQSHIYRVKVLAKRPPVPLSPDNKSVVRLFDDEPVIAFRWANPGRLDNMTVEVAESPDFKTGYRTVDAGERDFAEFSVNKSGTYFWRVTGYLKGTREPLSSAILSFTTTLDKALERPVLIAPDNGYKMQVSGDAGSLLLQWKAAADAKEYKVTLVNKQNKSTKDYTTLSTQLALTNLEPGAYEWKVSAVYEDTKTPEINTKASDAWNFTVARLPEIQWKNTDSSYYYLSETPEVFAEWIAPSPNAVSYRVKIRPLDKENESIREESVQTTFVKAKVQSDGPWLLTVEALDAMNNVVARSREKRLNVQMAPLPAAPVFSADLPNPLQATKRGSVTLSWSPVPGVQNYVVELLDDQGEPRYSAQTDKTVFTFNRLKPGNYFARVTAVDPAGRRSPASDSRDVFVPETSDIRAPKMMKVEVK